VLEKLGSAVLKQKVKIKAVLSRPHITLTDLLVCEELDRYLKVKKCTIEAIEQAEIEIKYSGYLNKEKESAEKLSRLENIKIVKDFKFDKLHSISTEGREKLTAIQPKTIGQASRISGVSPSDINVLLIYLGR
jgi:tRNA uridine 5-carboxymethylaminomethyl modification enzyme